MNAKRPLQRGALIAGCFLLGIGSITVGEQLVSLLGTSVEGLEGSRERLRRIRGWLAAEQEVTTLQDRVWGPLARLSDADLEWEGQVRFQAAAQEAGLEIQEFRPARAPAAPGQKIQFLLDAKLAGKLDQLSRLLRKLPETIAGVELIGLQLSPLEGGQVLGVLRLRWRGP